MATLLEVELVPSTCWGSNLRSELTPAQWNLCKHYVQARSGKRCEVCGGVGDKWPVECHEKWEYLEVGNARWQRLVGLEALCPRCHQCRHAGYAASQNRLHLVLMQLCEVNGWALEHAELYLEAVFEVWSQRSQHEWALDTTWLTSIGLPGSTYSIEERRAMRRA